MDKNTVTGFVLIALVVIGFSWYSQPSKEELEAMARQDSIAAVEKEKTLSNSPLKGEDSKQEVSPLRGDLEGSPDSTALFFARRNGEEQRITLKNNKVKVNLNSKGAVVEDAEIIGYKSRRREGDVVILGKEDASMKLTLPLKQENLCLADLTFDVTEQTDNSVTFAVNQEGKQLQVRYSLRPDAYMLDMDITSQGMREPLQLPHLQASGQEREAPQRDEQRNQGHRGTSRVDCLQEPVLQRRPHRRKAHDEGHAHYNTARQQL